MVLPSNALAEESYLIFTGWIIMGFFLNYRTFKKDRKRRYGHSAIVWIVLFSLSIYTSASFVWQSGITSSREATNAIEAHYSAANEQESASDFDDVVFEAMRSFRLAQMRDYLLTLLMILVSFRILMGNYSILNKRKLESERELGETRAKAFTDKLTGVKSLHAYRDKEREIDGYIEDGTAFPFAVAICDVNDVKEVNDTQGHQAGDEFIRAGCKIICDTFDHSPVYRIGGDEFVVLLEGRDFEQKDELEQRFKSDNLERMRDGGIVIALGIAVWDPENDGSFADAFARADIVMYKQKRDLKALRTSQRDSTSAAPRS